MCDEFVISIGLHKKGVGSLRPGFLASDFGKKYFLEFS